ncbi:DUF11 domain-containing protein [Nocardiopsis alborubida]|uniref:DUF11 domain-containing protein n=1 Tax=Nocardiopsis alborubida TaxID=146802 RepID=A0A7X6MFQ3_9ACTN|nr:DUF11 domain-containing protein [Nocardiopsis alborubida]NKY98700.1 DUF11 domain-containing protein [Nocardiopsis alborubida]
MAVATAVSAVGLVALLALPGAHHAPGEPGGGGGEVVPGADSLHVALESRADAQRPGPGDRIHYTVDVRNAGGKAVSDAEIVQFLPPTVRYVSGTPGAETGEGRVTWSRSLEPGDRATMRFTGEITAVRGGGLHPVATVCARPEPGAVLVSCDAAVHRVHGVVPPVWVVTALAFAASVALCVGGLVRHRDTRARREREHGPEAALVSAGADGARGSAADAPREPAGAGSLPEAERAADRPRPVLESLVVHRAAPDHVTGEPVGARAQGVLAAGEEPEPREAPETVRVPDPATEPEPEAGPRAERERVPAESAPESAEEPEPVAGPRA